MRRFWKARREDEVERFMRAHRAEPRDEFVASLLERLETQRHRFRPQRLGRRILVAAALTALAVGAGVAAGGTHVAGTSISNLVRVGESGIHGSKGENGDKGHNSKHHHGGSGDYQYTVPVCHHTHSKKNPWVEIFVSPQGAANHVKHHPLDYIVGAGGNPDTCPP